jgi:membrane protease YdiL (CAAX protease family)
VLLVSLLFAVAHVPKALFLGDWMSLLTFFPSLVMGWLYMKTNNILPGTIFHLLANLIHQGARYF